MADDKYELVLVNDKVRYYLIDYENVRQSGFIGAEKLTEKDKLVIFYSANADTMTFSLFELLRDIPAEVILFKAECGQKNALDFQLSTYLGYIIASFPEADCHIISADKGYEFIRAFWKKQGVKIKISVNIAGDVIKLVDNNTDKIVKENVTPIETEFDICVKKLNLSKSDKNQIQLILNKYVKGSVSQRKQNISNALTKQFGNSKNKIYYQAIKPLIK